MAQPITRTALKHPALNATVNVTDADLERFLAAGYTRVGEKSDEPNLEAPSTKADYLALAKQLGLDVDAKSSKADIVKAVEAAQASTPAADDAAADDAAAGDE